MSVPGAKTIIARLRKEGSEASLKLAKTVEDGAADYKCSECGLPAENPGIVLGPDDDSEFGNKIVFYCPFCSPERVRPFPVEDD